MKTTKILYWTFTILLAIAMIFSSIGNVMVAPEAIALFEQLGYPQYIIPFVGWAKLLGIMVILLPGFKRLKEWAYAGLTIDIFGATYSMVAIGETFQNWWPMLIFLFLIAASYYYHIKRQVLQENAAPDLALQEISRD